MAKDLRSRVAELEADKERSNATFFVLEKEVAGLKKYKQDFYVAVEKLKKKVAELKNERKPH